MLYVSADTRVDFPLGWEESAGMFLEASLHYGSFSNLGLSLGLSW